MNAQLIVEPLTAATAPIRSSSNDVHDDACTRCTPPASFYPSPELMEMEIASVLEIKLNPGLLDWVSGYAKVGHRNPFLWNWCRRGVEITQLSCVDPALADSVCDTRVLGIMLDVLLDDIADFQKDLVFLETLLGVLETGDTTPLAALPAHRHDYAKFTIDVWNEIQRRIRAYPRYAEFAELLRFDYRQLFNVMRYSRLTSEYPEMFNLVEHDLYLPHNMHMMISATMDLMASPAFDRLELGMLREIIWRAQCMGRIGNMITTWQREIGENDFTSAVFARAVACGDLAVADLCSENRILIEAAIHQKKHEEHFLGRWQALRQEILSMTGRCRCVDVSRLVTGLQRLICLHLGSRGKK